MKSFLFSAHAGAIVTMLAALLIICGNFLPSHGDYQWLPSGRPLVLPFLVMLPLITFAIGTYCWFWKVRGIFFALSLLFIVLALLLHCYLELVNQMLLCFDKCPSGDISVGWGFWLPLLGYLLSGFGLVIAYAAQRSKTGKAVSVSKQD